MTDKSWKIYVGQPLTRFIDAAKISIVSNDSCVAVAHGKTLDEAKKHAGIIVAAPLLLRACKAIDTEGRDANRDGGVIISSEVWDLVQQAIERAKPV